MILFSDSIHPQMLVCQGVVLKAYVSTNYYKSYDIGSFYAKDLLPIEFDIVQVSWCEGNEATQTWNNWTSIQQNVHLNTLLNKLETLSYKIQFQ